MEIGETNSHPLLGWPGWLRLALCLIVSLVLLLVLLGVNWIVAFALAAVGSLVALKMGEDQKSKIKSQNAK